VHEKMGCGGSEEVEIEAIYIDEEEMVENPPPVFKSKEQEAIDASPLLAFTIKFEDGECQKEVRSMSRVRGLKRELVKKELSKVHADWAVQLLLVWTDPSAPDQVVELENDNRWSELEAIGIKAGAVLEVRGVAEAIEAAKEMSAQTKMMGKKAAAELGEKLSDDELKALFEQFDSSGDGTISVNELGDVFRDLSEDLDDLSEEELKKWLSELDLDHDGKLDLNEFKAAFAGE